VVAIDEAGKRSVPDPNSAIPYRLAVLIEKSALIRLAMIGVAVLAVVGCFVFVGG
jgi:hypothetical protein